jgi:RNA polymerase sigma-70 factor (ECF subfamily)
VQDEIFIGHRDPLVKEQRIALRMMIVNRPSAVARQPDCAGTAGVTIALFARGSIQGAMASPPDTESPAAASLESQIRDVAAVAREQDRGAFARLFAHFAPRVKGYLLRLGAERVWRKAPAYDPKLASPSTWIFAIARNRRIDALRRDKRTALDPSDPGLLPEAELLPDRALDAGAWERRLAGAIGGLPPEQAQMLRLAYYEDRSHGDIAASLRLPLGTVKSRLRLAIARLRTMFETDA